MPNWTESMQQTFEYYIVDPSTWKDIKRIDNVKSCTINRDLSVETLGSASFDITDDLGECYIRVYLITVQNRVKEKHPLGTYLIQTPSSKFDGRMRTISMDAYTPLLELKENQPQLGYSIKEKENIMDTAYRIVRENARAPVIEAKCDKILNDDFVFNTDDTWLSFTKDLIAKASYNFSLDEMGRILFAPVQDMESLQPVFPYNDDNSSILQADVTLDRDLYGIPNVVEVIYSSGKYSYYGKAINNDSGSPVSIVNRGREIVYRVTNPDLIGLPSEKQIQEYANKVLKELSAIEYTITYTHGYNTVRLGDCVRFNYTRAGLTDIKAKVISQSIKCESGCPVSETAVFTKNLWG